MAQDGSQPVQWHGQAFPYLLHHPGSIKTETYGSARLEQQSSGGAAGHGQPTQGDRTGVWNGPAPHGYVSEPRHAQDNPPAVAASTAPEPDYVTLPGGARMPLLGLGTYKLDSPAALATALNIGYRHIDCARIYGNESLIGQGIRDFLASAGGDGTSARESLWITSKIWNDAHRPEAVKASAEASIADLGCGYLDLLLIHWPHAWKPGTEEPDEGVTMQETWTAMESLVEAGLVRHLGVSNFSLAQVEDVLSWAKIKPVVNQIELHPLLAQRKLVGVCGRKGVRCVGYSPLGHSVSDVLAHPAVTAVAEETGRTPAQVALRWNIQRGVAVIPKAGSEAHVRENFEGLFTWKLTWDQKAALDRADEGRRFVDFEWHSWDDPEEGGAVKPSKVLL